MARVCMYTVKGKDNTFVYLYTKNVTNSYCFVFNKIAQKELGVAAVWHFAIINNRKNYHEKLSTQNNLFYLLKQIQPRNIQ